MNRPPLEQANVAKAQAHRARAAALISVAEGRHTIVDVIKHAATEAGRPLLRITLRQLLLAQPGWGDERCGSALNQLTAVLGAPAAKLHRRKLTIAWLLDARAGGKRFMAFCDVIAAKTDAPWPGFPFAAYQPSTHGNQGRQQ